MVPTRKHKSGTVRIPCSLLDTATVSTMIKKQKRAKKSGQHTVSARCKVQRKPAAPSRCNHTSKRTGRSSSVYVLELQGGFIYVGKSKDLACRFEQHSAGAGSSFTKKYPPTGRLLPRLGTLEGDGDGPERDETLRQMHAHGIDKVRGWKFCTRKKLKEVERIEAESNIRELFDLCRRCGRRGHFARFCKNRVDREGHPIKK